MHMYMTSALSKNDMKAIGLQMALDLLAKKEKRDSITGLRTRTQPGRPDWGKVRPCSTQSLIQVSNFTRNFIIVCVCVCCSCFRKCLRRKKGKSTCFTAAPLLSPRSSRLSVSTSNSTSIKRTSEHAHALCACVCTRVSMCRPHNGLLTLIAAPTTGISCSSFTVDTNFLHFRQ